MDDFGTGLRAHLGLDAAQLELAAEPVAPPAQPVAGLVEDEVGEPGDTPVAPAPLDTDRLDALVALEAELRERERELATREAKLAHRAAILVAAAQALHDEVVGAASTDHDDELARLRQRKSMA